MDEQKAIHFRDRAESFLRLMRLGLNTEIVVDWLGAHLPLYENAVALLAVHAGISFSDAVLVQLTGQRSNAQSHHQVVATLRTACHVESRNADGVKHFSWLISHKDRIAYGDQRLTSDLVKAGVNHVERFAAWVYRVIPELASEPGND